MVQSDAPFPRHREDRFLPPHRPEPFPAQEQPATFARRNPPPAGPLPQGDGNHLLAAFPAREAARLAADCEEVPLLRGQVLFDPGQVPAHVHFPHAGTMISLVVPLQDGGETETITVGLEGAAGLAMDPTDTGVPAFLRAIVQMPGLATRVPAARLAAEAAASPPLRRLLARHAEAAASMALQSVACNAAHPLRERLARWLLVTLDRASGPGASDLPLTQEFLGQMLGVRRATVGEALLAFQAEGLVRIRRGGLIVRDRAGLGRAACECYGAVRRRYLQLLGATGQGAMRSVRIDDA